MRKKRNAWPRWAKILRNSLLAALLGLLMWDAWDQPYLTFRGDLRKKERQMLFPEREFSAELKTPYHSYKIKQEDNAVLIAEDCRGRFFSSAQVRCLLCEKPALFCFSLPILQHDKSGQPVSCAAYAAFQPPEDSAGAVLTLHNNAGDFAVEGVREENMFLFYARPDPDEKGTVSMDSSWFREGYFTYELTFFDKNGNRMEEIRG